MSTTDDRRPLVSMQNIHVRYEDVTALSGVDFDLYPGEIHAVIGEHRAGKSTLVKLLSGSARKDRGTILYKGRRIDYFTPESALRSGIGTVYQETTLIPAVSAIENIYTGQMPKNRFGIVNHQKMHRSAEAAFSRLDFEIDLDVPIHRLSPAQQHMVEFVRAIMLEPEVIILDELANKLTPAEMKLVYRTLFETRAAGTGIIYISHDLDEVLKLADRVTILRNGYRRGTEPTSQLDKYRLFQLTYSYSLDRERLEHSRMKFFLLKRYLENIINFLPVATVILDPDDRVRLTNVMISDILGMNPDTILDSSVEELLEPFPHETAAQIRSAMGDKRQISLQEIEIAAEHPVNVKVVPLNDEDGAFLGSALMVEDVSLNRYMQNYLVQSEKMASVAEVAVGVAHEINNPLFIIKNYLQVIKESSAEPTLREKIDKIESEAGRIMDIVASLLSFSRMPQKSAPTVNLRNVVEEVLTLLHHRVDEKGVLLVRKLNVEEAIVQGDENKLKQVFMNLLLNSLDAVLQQGSIVVSLGQSKNRECYELRIRDDGYGIPEDVAESIFNPFFSTKVTKKNTGLGLSICRSILDDHGGSIDFTSTPGEFTEFVVSLPVA